MRVLVVARTRMSGDRVCVGGLDIDSGASLRLLGRDENNLHEDHPVRPGEIWDVTCTPRARVRPPHVEDVVVTIGKRLSSVTDLKQAILALCSPWNSGVDEIFGSHLDVTSAGTAFLRCESPLPACSTGFWIAPYPITKQQWDERSVRYRFRPVAKIRSAKYVGMDEPIDVIPQGSLIRFSLARWAEFPPGVGEQRCYLQLSGWYV